MKPEDVLAIAQEGNPKVIAAIINRTTEPHGIFVRIARRGRCLYVLLEGAVTNQQDALVSFMQNSLQKLQLRPIDSAIIYGRPKGQVAMAWSEHIKVIPITVLSGPQSNAIPPFSPTPNPELSSPLAAKQPLPLSQESASAYTPETKPYVEPTQDHPEDSDHPGDVIPSDEGQIETLSLGLRSSNRDEFEQEDLQVGNNQQTRGSLEMSTLENREKQLETVESTKATDPSSDEIDYAVDSISAKFQTLVGPFESPPSEPLAIPTARPISRETPDALVETGDADTRNEIQPDSPVEPSGALDTLDTLDKTEDAFAAPSDVIDPLDEVQAEGEGELSPASDPLDEMQSDADDESIETLDILEEGQSDVEAEPSDVQDSLDEMQNDAALEPIDAQASLDKIQNDAALEPIDAQDSLDEIQDDVEAEPSETQASLEEPQDVSVDPGDAPDPCDDVQEEVVIGPTSDVVDTLDEVHLDAESKANDALDTLDEIQAGADSSASEQLDEVQADDEDEASSRSEQLEVQADTEGAASDALSVLDESQDASAESSDVPGIQDETREDIALEPSEAQVALDEVQAPSVELSDGPDIRDEVQADAEIESSEPLDDPQPESPDLNRGPDLDNVDLDAFIRYPEALILIFFTIAFFIWQTYRTILDDAAPEGRLTSSRLARRLGVHRSTISRRKEKEGFEEWTQNLDPDGLAWSYEEGFFVPHIGPIGQ